MNPGYIKFIGVGAGILTSISMLPQLIKTFKEKKAEDISIFMLLVLMSGIGAWIYYGILRKDYLMKVFRISKKQLKQL